MHTAQRKHVLYDRDGDVYHMYVYKCMFIIIKYG